VFSGFNCPIRANCQIEQSLLSHLQITVAHGITLVHLHVFHFLLYSYNWYLIYGTHVNVWAWFHMCNCVCHLWMWHNGSLNVADCANQMVESWMLRPRQAFPRRKGQGGLKCKDVAYILNIGFKVPNKQHADATKIEKCKWTRELPYVRMLHTICPAAANEVNGNTPCSNLIQN